MKKLDLENIIPERNQIIRSFPTPIEKTSLLATDISDHRLWLEKVYRELLHDAGVIDDCCRRFESMFKDSSIGGLEIRYL